MHGEEGGVDGTDNKLLETTLARTGAYIMGKRMFEEGELNWPEDLYKADVYVLNYEYTDCKHCLTHLRSQSSTNA